MAKSKSIRELCDAVELGSLKTVQQLVETSVDLDGTDSSRKLTPLTTAIEHGRTEIALFLLQQGASPTARPGGYRKEKPLHFACRVGNHEVARRLLELGVDVNDVMKPHNDPAGRTPLMDAAIGGHIQLLQLLVEEGAQLNARDEAGNTAVWWANSDEVREFLIQQLDESPLDTSPGQLVAAVREGRHDHIQSLLDAGVSVDDVDARGETALMAAVSQLDLKMARLLIKAGADVNYRSERGFLPLTSHPNMKTRMAKLLLENGADPNAEIREGQTAMSWAVMSATKLQVKAMLDAGGRLELSPFEQQELMDRVRQYNRGVLPLLQDLFDAEPNDIDSIRAHVKQFPTLSQLDAFQAEAERIGKIVNRKPTKWKRRKGVTLFYNVSVVKYLAKYFDEPAGDTTDDERACDLFARFSTEVLAKGFTLIMNDLAPEKGGYPLLLFPTSDKYAVLAAVGTNGVNYGHSTDDVIRWLREMEQENPFRLVDAGHDFVGGRFIQPVQNAEQLTERMIAFCPDVTDFAAGSPEPWSDDQVRDTLAESVAAEQAFGFWWD